MPDALAGLYRGRSAGDQVLVEAASNALVHGYGLGPVAAGIALIAAAVVGLVLVNAGRDRAAATGAALH